MYAACSSFLFFLFSLLPVYLCIYLTPSCGNLAWLHSWRTLCTVFCDFRSVRFSMIVWEGGYFLAGIVILRFWEFLDSHKLWNSLTRKNIQLWNFLNWFLTLFPLCEFLFPSQATKFIPPLCPFIQPWRD